MMLHRAVGQWRTFFKTRRSRPSFPVLFGRRVFRVTAPMPSTLMPLLVTESNGTYSRNLSLVLAMLSGLVSADTMRWYRPTVLDIGTRREDPIWAHKAAFRRGSHRGSFLEESLSSVYSLAERKLSITLPSEDTQIDVKCFISGDLKPDQLPLTQDSFLHFSDW